MFIDLPLTCAGGTRGLPRAAAVAIVMAGVHAPASSQPPRILPQANLSAPDPVWTAVHVARNHGQLMCDVLRGAGSRARIEPPMVPAWQRSRDQRTSTMILCEGGRDGGKPARSGDMIASIHRGPQRTAMGITLRGGVGEVGAIAARCVRIVLREPFGPLLEAVGKAGSSCVIGSRAAVEAQVTEPIESAGDYGSCCFEPDGLKPGARMAYLRNAACARRIGPPSGTAGGEPVAVERIEEKITGGGMRWGDASVGALREGQRRPSGSRSLRVFQDLNGSPNPRRAIGASLIEGAASVGLPPAIGRREATGTHNTVRMPTEDPARYPSEFAGGRRQRLAIARAGLPATSIAAGGVGPLDVSLQAQRLNALRSGAAPHHHRLALHCARSACGGTTARSYLCHA